MKISNKDRQLLINEVKRYIDFFSKMDSTWKLDGKEWSDIVVDLSDEEKWANAVLEYNVDVLDYVAEGVITKEFSIDEAAEKAVDSILMDFVELEYISGLEYPGEGNWVKDEWDVLDFKNSQGIIQETYSF